MGQAGPALIVAMTTPVTPCGDIPDPTVLDPWTPTDHPAATSGDVGGTDEIPVAAEPAEPTAKVLPLGLGTLRRQARQVEEVPRSSTSTTSMPAMAALSFRAPIRCVRPQLRSRRFWRLPASRLQIPSGPRRQGCP